MIIVDRRRAERFEDSAVRGVPRGGSFVPVHPLTVRGPRGLPGAGARCTARLQADALRLLGVLCAHRRLRPTGYSNLCIIISFYQFKFAI